MWQKQPLSFFDISENMQENQQKIYISDILWTFKSELRIIHVATHIAVFLHDSHNCFLYV